MITLAKSLVKRTKSLRNSRSLYVGIMQVSVLVFNYLLQILLANLLGQNNYGIYTHAISFVTLLGIPAALGFNPSVIRLVAQFNKINQGTKQNELRILSTIIAFLIGSTFGLSSFLISEYTGLTLVKSDVYLILFAIPLIAISNIQSAFLRANQKYLQSVGFNNLLRLCSLILLVCLGNFFLRSSYQIVVIFFILSLLIAISVQTVFLNRIVIKKQSKWSNITLSEAKGWIAFSFPMLLSASALILIKRSDLLMLGYLGDFAQVAKYNVALRLSEIITFGSFALSFTIGPKIAKAYMDKDIKRIEKLARGLATNGVLLGILIAITLVTLKEPLLQLFGPEFIGVDRTLYMLITGYLISTFFGGGILILNMTVFQKASALFLLLAAAVNILLNLILIPRFGGLGAGIAMTVSLFLWNSLASYWVYRKLRIYTTPYLTLPLYRKVDDVT